MRGLSVVQKFEVGPRVKKTQIRMLLSAHKLVCQLICASKFVHAFVCALICPPKLLCVLEHAPKPLCALVCEKKEKKCGVE